MFQNYYLKLLFTDPGFVVPIIFPLFPSFMFSDEIVLDRLSLKLSIRDALALNELDVLKLSLKLLEIDVLKLSLSLKDLLYTI